MVHYCDITFVNYIQLNVKQNPTFFISHKMWHFSLPPPPKVTIISNIWWWHLPDDSVLQYIYFLEISFWKKKINVFSTYCNINYTHLVTIILNIWWWQLPQQMPNDPVLPYVFVGKILFSKNVYLWQIVSIFQLYSTFTWWQ